MNTSDIISIIDIGITSILGLWIAIGVQRSLTKNRYLKEYFINEINNIREEYRIFFSDIYAEKLNAKTIKDRLKIMTGRISSFDKYIHQIYKINNSLLKDGHANFQQFITGEDEFNGQFSDPQIKFSNHIKTELFRKQTELAEIITQRVIDINKAHKKWHFHN